MAVGQEERRRKKKLGGTERGRVTGRERERPRERGHVAVPCRVGGRTPVMRLPEGPLFASRPDRLSGHRSKLRFRPWLSGRRSHPVPRLRFSSKLPHPRRKKEPLRRGAPSHHLPHSSLPSSQGSTYRWYLVLTLRTLRCSQSASPSSPACHKRRKERTHDAPDSSHRPHPRPRWPLTPTSPPVDLTSHPISGASSQQPSAVSVVS